MHAFAPVAGAGQPTVRNDSDAPSRALGAAVSRRAACGAVEELDVALAAQRRSASSEAVGSVADIVEMVDVNEHLPKHAN